MRKTKKRSVKAVSTSSPSTSSTNDTSNLNDITETVDVDGEVGGNETTVEYKRPAGRDSTKNKIKKGDLLYKMMASLQEDKKIFKRCFCKRARGYQSTHE